MISKSLTQHQDPDPPTDVTIRGWYVPDGKTRPGKRCVVEGCNEEAAYNLCIHHAIPGMVIEVATSTFVIGAWLVKQRDALQLLTLNDFALGDLFAGRAGFETQLANQGYQVIGLISSLEELEATKLRHPGLQFIMWSPNLPASAVL